MLQALFSLCKSSTAPKENKKPEKKPVLASGPAVDLTGKDVVLYYGSQTGIAEGFAHELAGDLSTLKKLDAVAVGIEEFKPAEHQFRGRHVFLQASYGDGGPTDNAEGVFEWFDKVEENEKCLDGVMYAAFGLGNTE